MRASSNSLPLLGQVEQGGLDAAIIARPAGLLPSGLTSYALLDDEILAIVSELNPLSSHEDVELAELANHTLITYGLDSRLRPLIAEAFATVGQPLDVAYSTHGSPRSA